MERHPNRGIAVFDAIAKSPNVQVLPRTRAWKQYSDLLTSSFDAIWGGADAAAEMRDCSGVEQYGLLIR